MNLSNYLENRLEDVQNRKLKNKKKNKILLMTHLIAGYPSFEDNWRMLEAMGEADVDLVEMQMPFSEPTADGPLFVKANQEALRNGVCWKSYFDLMKRASDKLCFTVVPISLCCSLIVPQVAFLQFKQIKHVDVSMAFFSTKEIQQRV